MKSVFIILCLGLVAVQALTDEQLYKLSSHTSKCLEDTKADPKAVTNLKNGEFLGVDEPLKHFTFCLMLRANLINIDGVLNKDVILGKVFVDADKPLVLKLVDECAHLQGSKPQDIAWNFATCYHQKNKKYSIFQ